MAKPASAVSASTPRRVGTATTPQITLATSEPTMNSETPASAPSGMPSQIAAAVNAKPTAARNQTAGLPRRSPPIATMRAGITNGMRVLVQLSSVARPIVSQRRAPKECSRPSIIPADSEMSGTNRPFDRSMPATR